MPNIQGKVALVTGGNSGLGYETVKALAIKGAKVYLACRDLTKGEKAKSDLIKLQSDAQIEVLKLDLASIKGITQAAQQIKSSERQLDILVNNAGLMAMPYQETEDGFESQFGVNHLGHWVLTSSVFELLLATENSRVVTVTSTAHHMARSINDLDPNFKDNYSAWGSYGHSKLANYYFAIGLHRIFQNAKVSQLSLLTHPGLTRTNLQVQTAKQGGGGFAGKISEPMTAKLGMDPWQGAQSQIKAALDPSVKSGEFYGPRFGMAGPPAKLPILKPGSAKEIEKLWKLSEKATGFSIKI